MTWVGVQDYRNRPQVRLDAECKIARYIKWSEGSQIKQLVWNSRSCKDQGDSYRAPYKYTRGRVKLFMPSSIQLRPGQDFRRHEST